MGAVLAEAIYLRQQDKGLASEPTLCPVTSTRSAGSWRGVQRRRLWRLLTEDFRTAGVFVP